MTLTKNTLSWSFECQNIVFSVKYELKLLYSSDVISLLKSEKRGVEIWNPNSMMLWGIWGFHCCVNEIFALLEFFEAQTGRFRHFGTTHLILENGIDMLSRNVGNSQSELRKNPRKAKTSKWCSFSHPPNKPITPPLSAPFLSSIVLHTPIHVNNHQTIVTSQILTTSN